MKYARSQDDSRVKMKDWQKFASTVEIEPGDQETGAGTTGPEKVRVEIGKVQFGRRCISLYSGGLLYLRLIVEQTILQVFTIFPFTVFCDAFGCVIRKSDGR